jgi:hypothetical protein
VPPGWKDRANFKVIDLLINKVAHKGKNGLQPAVMKNFLLKALRDVVFTACAAYFSLLQHSLCTHSNFPLVIIKHCAGSL